MIRTGYLVTKDAQGRKRLIAIADGVVSYSVVAKGRDADLAEGEYDGDMKYLGPVTPEATAPA